MPTASTTRARPTAERPRRRSPWSRRRVFVQRHAAQRLGDRGDGGTVLHGGDVLAVAGPRELLVGTPIGNDRHGSRRPRAAGGAGRGAGRVRDATRQSTAKRCRKMADAGGARRVPAEITRGATATTIPILADTTKDRARRHPHAASAAPRTSPSRPRHWASPTRRVTDVSTRRFIGRLSRLAPCLIGSLVFKVKGVPLDALHCRRQALVAGIVGGWLASRRPSLRAHSFADDLVHELRRPEHFHRDRRASSAGPGLSTA